MCLVGLVMSHTHRGETERDTISSFPRLTGVKLAVGLVQQKYIAYKITVSDFNLIHTGHNAICSVYFYVWNLKE